MPSFTFMDAPFALIQFAVSLLAIFALAGLAYWLRLGAAPVLTSAADISRAADEVSSGFEPQEHALNDDGTSALIRGNDGRIMLIKVHGSKIAGRILDGRSRVSSSDGTLLIDSGERNFGGAAFRALQSEEWARAIRAIGKTA